jgi:hypothetical protein
MATHSERVVPSASGDKWTMYNGDCVQVVAQLPESSVDFSVFSPPFSSLYVYSDDQADMGNCADDDEFFQHFGYLIPELARVTLDGRLCAVHCKDLPRYMSTHGESGLTDFPGAIVRAFESSTPSDGSRWVFHSRCTIWKDPVIEMQRTKTYGLLYKSFRERAEVTRQGMADYVLVFRKWHDRMESGTSAKPVKHDRVDYPLDVWQRWASPVWNDIQQTRVLNVDVARDDQDEKHICPLQLDVIDRAIELWSNPGDVVLSPFAGIGSEGDGAIRLGRKFVGVELKPRYYEIACRNLTVAESEGRQATLFDSVAQ